MLETCVGHLLTWPNCIRYLARPSNDTDSVLPKIKPVLLATQTRRATTHLQTYRERCARQLQGNVDGANTLESMTYL